MHVYEKRYAKAAISSSLALFYYIVCRASANWSCETNMETRNTSTREDVGSSCGPWQHGILLSGL